MLIHHQRPIDSNTTELWSRPIYSFKQNYVQVLLSIRIATPCSFRSPTTPTVGSKTYPHSPCLCAVVVSADSTSVLLRSVLSDDAGYRHTVACLSEFT